MRYEALEKEFVGWMNKKKHLNEFMDNYAKYINILSPTAVMYRVKLDSLVRFYNELVRKIPWKLDDTLEDTDKRNIPSTMHHFL